MAPHFEDSQNQAGFFKRVAQDATTRFKENIISVYVDLHSQKSNTRSQICYGARTTILLIYV
jgi:hypothetical protein